MVKLLPCECGETPEILKPNLSRRMKNSDPAKFPGRFFPTLHCKCGIMMWGEDFDELGTGLAETWNIRQERINDRQQGD